MIFIKGRNTYSRRKIPGYNWWYMPNGEMGWFELWMCMEPPGLPLALHNSNLYCRLAFAAFCRHMHKNETYKSKNRSSWQTSRSKFSPITTGNADACTQCFGSVCESVITLLQFDSKFRCISGSTYLLLVWRGTAGFRCTVCKWWSENFRNLFLKVIRSYWLNKKESPLG